MSPPALVLLVAAALSSKLLLQVDLIVCFDSDASPIRNIQRMGRTGRHKPGRVVYIMSQGKEEDSYRKGLQVSLQCLYQLTGTTVGLQLQAFLW